MTTVHFISGKQIHCEAIELDDIKELVRDQEGIPIEEQVIQPCWGGSRDRGTNMCISMRTRGGKHEGHDTRRELLKQVQSSSSKFITS